MWSLIIRSPDHELQEFCLKGVTKLGRLSKNDIVLDDDSSSRQHAEISYDLDTDEITIQDRNSLNGTFVNGKRIASEQRLEHEDQIRIGSSLITLVSSDQSSIFENRYPPTKIPSTTREFLFESIDHYAVLLVDIGRRLVNAVDLDSALLDLSDLVKRLIGADDCQIVLEKAFGRLDDRIPSTKVIQRVVKNEEATLQSRSAEGVEEGLAHTNLCVPILGNGGVAAVVYAEKTKPGSRAFDVNDLKLVVAVAHQIGLTIQRLKIENELLYKANHDSLTGLPNKSRFIEELRKLIVKAKQQEGYKFSLHFMDLDNFKIVNDSLGHEVGDQLLVEISRRLQDYFENENDPVRLLMISRFGGDEFALLFESEEGSHATMTAAQRIQEQLLKPFPINGKKVFTTASFGIAISCMNYTKPEEMLRDADIALYRAKAIGKARFKVYDQDFHQVVTERLKIQKDLREAVHNGELSLHFQPIISLASDQVVGFESLLRWDSPERGLVYPERFLSLSDTTGLLNDIDHWVLEQSVKQISAWQKQFPSDPPLFININLSGKQIKHPSLIDEIDRILDETGVDPHCLWLEIPEGVNIEKNQATLEMLALLRKKQIQLCLDDFGTGFSSLSYLHRFPIQALKIDRSFTTRIGKGNGGSEIINTIVKLASHLGMKLIAEGVESKDQLDYLKSVKCDYVQGYFFTKPLKADEMTGKISELMGKKRA